MSKPSNRPNREEIKRRIKERKKAQKELRRRQETEGMVLAAKASIANRKSEYESVEQEREARMDAVSEQVKVFRAKLPVLLGRLSKIPDPRESRKVKHKLTVLLIYGILSFVYQMASRRQANERMTRPMFMENLRLVFPELESVAHHDTLDRLLCRIEVDQIEAAHVELIRSLMKGKKFGRYLIDHCYPIAIDGTQKLARDWPWSEQCLRRRVSDSHSRHYVYVVEASLAFHNGMTIPFMSEFLGYEEGMSDSEKQDCEYRGFYRLGNRLKGAFGHLRIMLLLDGLYPNGPIMEFCRKMGWQYMIVLQDGSLRSVWEEFDGLKGLEPKDELRQTWGNRRQRFQWVNDIEYRYGANERKKQMVHVVVCEESWEEVGADSCEVVTKRGRHAWISSEPLDRWNVHERCNMGARHRWGIEEGFLVEKWQGYQYEHLFSHDWNAMRGYHFLMRLGHMLNLLVQYSEGMKKFARRLGARGWIRFVRETMAAPWLDPQEMLRRLSAPFQLRLA